MERLPISSQRQACIDGRLVKQPDPQALKAALEAPGGVVWLDVTAPSPNDAALLRDVFGLHPLALEDALKAGQRAKIEAHAGHYFITFYAAAYEGVAQRLRLQPLHLFVGPRFLVTVQQEPIRQVEETMQRWHTADSVLEPRAGLMAYALLDAIVDDYFPILDAVAEEIDALEERLFTTGEAEVMATVFVLKKELLRLRRRVAPERDVVNVLLRREQHVFEPADVPYLQDLYDHLVRITENVDLYRDLLSIALDSHLSFQSNRLNQIVKVLTVASIILMSNALVAGIYGMNFEQMPELSWTYGYPLALGLMAALSGGLFLFFRHRGWL